MPSVKNNDMTAAKNISHVKSARAQLGLLSLSLASYKVNLSVVSLRSADLIFDVSNIFYLKIDTPSYDITFF